MTMPRVSESGAARVPRLESHAGAERPGASGSTDRGDIIPERDATDSSSLPVGPIASNNSATNIWTSGGVPRVPSGPASTSGAATHILSSSEMDALRDSGSDLRASSSGSGSGPDEPTTPPLRESSGFEPPLPVHVPANRDLSGNLLLDRYRLLSKLGEGGMGTVYLAEHVTIKKRCAIKLLNPEYAHKQDLVERFLQEARAASMIAHENVVEITDFGAAHGSVFFVMEMLIGEDLADTIRREAPLPWSRVAPIALQICRALAAAHNKGIVHRDMKPENCFRVERHGNSDFIKVLDFGIAKVTSDDESEGTGPRLTSTGMIFGTPTYMSPEQAQGQRVDLRSDIYALGIILYELLTAKVPFSADNFMGILTKHMFDEPMAPSEAAPYADISPEVEAIVLKALQKERAYRFQTMEELSAAILAVGTGAEPVTVIPEARARPISEGRPTAFLTRSSSGAMSRMTGEVTLAERPRRSRGVLVAVAAGFAVLGGATTLLALGDDDPGPPPVVGAALEPLPPVLSVTPTPTPRVPQTDPVPVPTPVPAPDARVYVTSNVPAEVVDAADGTVLGATGDAGFTLAPDAGPRMVLVRAAGHDDLALELEPVADRRFEAVLRPKKKIAGRTGKPGDTRKPGTPAVDPKPAEPKHVGSMGLKNPFETRPAPP